MCVIDTRLARHPHHFAVLLALKPTFDIEVTTVQSDNRRDRIRVHVVVPVEAAKRIDLRRRYCPQHGQQPGVFRSSNMYDSPFQVTKFDGIHISHVTVLLLRRAQPSVLPMDRSTKDLRASQTGRRDD